MSERKTLPALELTVNVPVRVQPWAAKVVTTRYGDRLILSVKHEGAERELWAPLDFADELKAIGVAEVGTWEDSGKPKVRIRLGAPGVALEKRHPAGSRIPRPCSPPRTLPPWPRPFSVSWPAGAGGRGAREAG